MSNKAIQKLREMLNRIEKIEIICEKNQGIVKALEEEVYSQPAIMMHLIVIQEQIIKLQNESEYDILSHFTKEDLRGIAGIRNIASHDYEGLNFQL